MRGLDDTDREILRLLLEDARRPYSEIADAVGLSAPAVSDRVDRLQDIGLVRRFTLDVDRALLAEGVPVLVTVDTTPGAAEGVRESLVDTDPVEYVFRTVDDRVVFTATVPGGEVGGLLDDAVGVADVRDYDVRLLADSDWSPTLSQAEFAPDCAECGNAVTDEGETERLDDEVYHFCCGNCRETFVAEYQRIREGA
jgi:DNA-binding Lrp family transcriptional regulator